MAAATLIEIPSSVEMPAGAVSPNNESQVLGAIAIALGMDPNSKNEFQVPDVDFLQEMIKLPINFAGMPEGTDVEGMRRWVNESFENREIVERRRNIGFRRRKSKQDVEKTIFSVECSDNSGEGFDLWLYQPSISDTEDQKSLRPAILMFHGGGWIHGDPSGDEFLAEIFASELNAVVIGVDYRLAPEHKFPLPLDDCISALQWTITHARQYHIDSTRIALWGASAGGNLAAALTLHHIDAQHKRELPNLCCVHLVVPVTAHPRAFATFEKKRDSPLSSNELLFANVDPAPASVVQEFERLLEMYIAGADLETPLISPLMAVASATHPRTNITVAACDYLRPQGQAYAELLRRVGVDVTEDILAGVPHGFTFAANAKVTRSWVERQIESFAEAFGLP